MPRAGCEPTAGARGYVIVGEDVPIVPHASQAGWQHKLTRVKQEAGGNIYRLDRPPMQGWLCPALFKYFEHAPKQIYVRADPRT